MIYDCLSARTDLIGIHLDLQMQADLGEHQSSQYEQLKQS